MGAQERRIEGRRYPIMQTQKLKREGFR